MGKNVQRKGGNAVITYRQCVDYEGDRDKRRLTVRGYGTAVFIAIDKIAKQIDPIFN